MLPPGMTISPSAANGLGACTDDQFGQGTDNPIACPDASKVGTASIVSPVLAQPLTGNGLPRPAAGGQPVPAVRRRRRLRALGAPQGQGRADPETGQLTTTFADTPQVPFSDFT